MKTITQALIDLKNSLKVSMHVTVEEFNKKLSEVYEQLLSQVLALEEQAENKTNYSIESLRKILNHLSQLMENYQKISEDKINTYRHDLVDKLDELNKQVNQYNNKHKH